MRLVESLRAKFYSILSEDLLNPHIQANAGNGGWLAAWGGGDPEMHLRHLDKREVREFFNFIVDRLLKLDPTEDKIYAPYIFRWFKAGLWMNDLKEAEQILARYHSDAQKGIKHELKLFERPVSRKGGRPFSADPLIAYPNIHDLSSYLWRQDIRREFAAHPEKIKARDERFLATEEVEILHRSPTLRVYLLNSYEAGKAYGEGTALEYAVHEDEEDSYRNLVQIELANGARYRTDHCHVLDSESDKHHPDLSRMLQGDPALTSVLLPYFQKTMASMWIGGQATYGKELAVIFSHVPGKGGFLTEGILANSFMDEVAFAEQSDERGDLKSAMREMCHVAASKSDREKIAPDFVLDLIQRTIARSGKKAFRILAIASTVPAWRETIQSEDVNRIFDVLPKKVPREQAELFCIVAKIVHWRNGKEAAHLPGVMNYLIKNRDWKKLKTILLCASYRDNEAWRAAVSPETRKLLRRSCNERYFSVLLDRLDALDRGIFQRMRLKEIPDTEDELDKMRKRIEKTRGDRAKLAGKQIYSAEVA